jgi:hypothetical protein
MLSNYFFSNPVDDIKNEPLEVEENKMIDPAKQKIDTDITEDDDDVAQDHRDRDDSSFRDESEKGASAATANNSILGDFSVFRDFFLAAFSDGYYKVRFVKHTCDKMRK